MADVMQPVVQAFMDAYPCGEGMLSHESMVGLLNNLLPSASRDELEVLVGAFSTGDGEVNIRDFIGGVSEDRFLGLEEQVGASPAKRSIPQMALPDNALGCPFAGVSSPKSGYVARDDPREGNVAFLMAEAARELLPPRVILVRHGESEGNVDPAVYRHKPDNAVELTEAGSQQALEAGKRIKQIVGDDRVQLIVSPFQRTLQTARNIEEAIGPQVAHVMKDPRIREQEFGNLQGDEFQNMRKEQATVGRYFYRFPTGESGADVHARVKDWWEHCVTQLNLRPGYPHVDTVVVVTHGLTMRFILMQLYDWSPNTFQTIWNAKNCEMYVLRRDLNLPGQAPYSLCAFEGDMPRSTISVNVEFRSGEKTMYRMDDYLSIPMPRTRQHSIVIAMLAKQHGLDPDEIVSVDMYGGRFCKYK